MNFIKSLFGIKYSKWYVLTTYNYLLTDYVIFARKNLNTGMIYFKTKSITNTNNNTKLFSTSFPAIDVSLKYIINL